MRSFFICRKFEENTPLKIPDKYNLAIEAAKEAAKAILYEYQNGFEVFTKVDGSPVTSADLKASKIIASHLQKTGVPIIGEELEKKPYSVRKNWMKHWSVDPLDGTKMFLAKRPEFAINIAFVEGNTPIFGLIADPVSGRILIGGADISPITIEKDGSIHSIDTSRTNEPIVVSCSRGFKLSSGSNFLSKVDKQFGGYELLRKSSSLKFFDLIHGHSDLYPRFAPTMEWDISSGHAILNAVGGKIVDADTKEELIYNKESLFNPNFIATRRHVNLDFE